MENYLSEITRVLKSDGRVFITYFLLNPESLKLNDEKVSHHNFRYNLQGCRVEREDVPEAAVGYDESAITQFRQKVWIEYFGTRLLRQMMWKEEWFKLARYDRCSQVSMKNVRFRHLILPVCYEI